MGVRPVPEGYHTLTPQVTVRGAAEAIDFYKRAFGAVELMRKAGPDGKLMHAEIKIGDSILMLNDEFPNYDTKSPSALGGAAGSLYVYLPDVDAAFARAVAAGATVVMPLQNMFWGDRCGKVCDPFGHSWNLSTHVEDLTPAEIDQRAAAFFGGGKK
jgi:uncharacterized glyoxalase superfamily protein PhnB